MLYPTVHSTNLKTASKSLSLAVVVGVAFSALCLLSAGAQTVHGTWEEGTANTAGTAYDWGTPANWVGDPDPVPGGPGSIVNFTAPLPTGVVSGTRHVNLNGNRTVGVLNLGGGNGSYNLHSGTGGSLIFDNGANNAELNFGTTYSQTISANMVLNSSLDINSSPSNSRTLAGNITAGGADEAKVITHEVAGSGALTLSGAISDGPGTNQVVSIHQSAAGIMVLSGDSSFSGGVQVSAGLLRLSSGNATALGTGTLTLDGGDLEILHFASINFGNDTVIASDMNIRIANTGTGAGRTWTLGALEIGNHEVTVENSGSVLSSTTDDTLVFGATTLTGDATFSVQSTSANNETAVLRLGALNGAFDLIKTGTGNLELNTAAGSYSGTTFANGGRLIVGNNTALGTGDAAVAGTEASVLRINTGVTLANNNNVLYSNTNAASAVERGLGAGAAFDTGTTANAAFRSDFVGGVDTSAALRAGTTSSATTLVMAFSPTATASNDAERRSDVFDLSGTGSNAYTLQLSTGTPVGDPIFLGWLNGGTWEMAGTQEHPDTTWNTFLANNGGEFNASMLGAHGYDSTTGTAWAVVDHGGEFAILVPEPSTFGLVGAGFGMLLAWRRARGRRS